MKKTHGFTGLTALLFLTALFFSLSSLGWSQTLYVGSNTPNNTLTLTNGTNSYQNTYIGYTTNAYSNTLTILTNTLLTNSAGIYVGNFGSFNMLLISNGGRAINSQTNNISSTLSNAYIGYYPESSNNLVLVTGEGSSWTNRARLLVGYLGMSNSLVISNGGTVFSGGIISVGDRTNSANNSIVVTDPNSLLQVTNASNDRGELDIGYFGSNNSMLISNGGTVIARYASIGFSTTNIGATNYASNNSVVVVGNATNSSVWRNSLELVVGNIGNSNSLLISNYAQVTNGTTYIGYDTVAHDNSSIVKGTSSFLANSNLYVGYAGYSNSLIISTNGSVTNSRCYIGYSNTAYANLTTVEGSNSLLSNNLLVVGYFGNSNNIVVTNGGHSINITNYIGYSSNSFGNVATVTGTNSLLSNNEVFVGYSGYSNSLVISNKGQAVNDTVYVGYTNTSSNNSIIVTGTNSFLSNNTTSIGFYGSSNSMVISNGGGVQCDTMVIGNRDSSSNNSVIVVGTNSYLSNSSLLVGNGGNHNSLIISNAGQVINGTSSIGDNSTSFSNSVTVIGPNSLFSNSTLYIGNYGTNNSMTISDGGQVKDVSAVIGYQTNSIMNSATVSGTNSLWSNSGDLVIGLDGASNNLLLTNGGRVYDSNGIIGYSSQGIKSSAIVTGPNSCWSNSGNLLVGYASAALSNSLVITNQGVVYSKSGWIGHDASAAGSFVCVTGTNSLWTNIGDINIEDGATLVISNYGKVVTGNYVNDGTITEEDGGQLIVADPTNTSTSITTVDGTDTTLTIDDGWVAYSGAIMTVKNGGVITVGDLQNQGTINIGTNGTFILGVSGDTTTSLIGGTISFGSINSQWTFNQAARANISATLTGGGAGAAINQTGSGITAYAGDASAWTGTINDTSGTFTLGAGGIFGSGITFNLNGGTFISGGNLNGAALNFTSGNAVINASSTAGNLTWNNAVPLAVDGGATLSVAALTLANSGSTYTNILSNAAIVNTVQTLISADSITGTASFVIAGPNASDYTTSLIGNTIGTVLNTNNLFTIVSGMNDYVPANTVSTIGALRVDNNAQLTLYQGSQLNVNSNATFLAASTTLWQVGTTTGLQVNGTAYFGGNLTLATMAASTSYWGKTYKFLSAATAIDGTFSSVTTTDPGLRARAIYDPDPEVDILFAPNGYEAAALNQNQTNVARALNYFTNATGGDNYTVSLALDQLTASQYPNAFQQISPALYSSLSTIAFNNANAQNQELVQRLGNIRVAGVGFDSTGLGDPIIVDDNKNPKTNGKDVLIPSADNHWGIFTDANGIFANVNINNQLPGYTSESGGVTLGADYKWNETFSTGIYTGYQGMQSKQSGGNFICDNSCRFGLFGTYQHGGLFANAILGGDSHSYQVDRTIQFPGINRTAISAPSAGELDSMLATGYDMKRGNFTFGPTTSLQYTFLGVQPFTEAGAQSLNLGVGNENANSMIYSLGSHCFYTWQLNKDVLVVPQINLAWQHEFLQNPYAINSSLQGGGGNFTYLTTTPNRDSLYTGIGFTVNFAKKYDASFFYNASAGNSDLVSQNFFASVGTHF